VIRFIEDNWLGGERIQPGGSFDTIAGSIEGMFTFSATTPDTAERQAEQPAQPPLDPVTGRKTGSQ
jgi:hypothetical protein